MNKGIHATLVKTGTTEGDPLSHSNNDDIVVKKIYSVLSIFHRPDEFIAVLDLAQYSHY